MQLQSKVGEFWTYSEAKGQTLFQDQMWSSDVQRGRNLKSHRSGDPTGDEAIVSCHHMLTCCAHKLPPKCGPETLLHTVKELPLIPSLHRLQAPHYAHCTGIPSSCFSHAHLALVSSSAEQGYSWQSRGPVAMAKTSHERLAELLTFGTSPLPTRSCPTPAHTPSMAPHFPARSYSSVNLFPRAEILIPSVPWTLPLSS